MSRDLDGDPIDLLGVDRDADDDSSDSLDVNGRSDGEQSPPDIDRDRDD